MVIQKIRLRQFRSYDDVSFTFKDGVNIIVGSNGTGKTNLLEAIYLTMQGVSFRVADKELMQYGSDWFRIDARFNDEKRSVRYQLHNLPTKQVVINDGARRRFTRTLRLPVVLFEPDMLRVLNGSPTRRRQLLDTLIMQWFDGGATMIRRYERVLMQRNNILKRAFELNAAALEDQLFAWDMSFAELALQIEAYRHQVVAILNATISDVYSQIAQKPQQLDVVYHGAAHFEKQHFMHQLQAHRRVDAARGYTTIGPHRSDFSVILNGQPSEITASRGEQRSIVLAMKQIEVSELESKHDTAPVLLLDDITGELDNKRVKSLLAIIDNYQVVATAAHDDPAIRQAAQHRISL